MKSLFQDSEKKINPKNIKYDPQRHYFLSSNSAVSLEQNCSVTAVFGVHVCRKQASRG